MTKADKARGVGEVAAEAIKRGLSNEDALAEVKRAFPRKGTSLASINWYRNKLRTEGKRVKTARELKAREKRKR